VLCLAILGEPRGPEFATEAALRGTAAITGVGLTDGRTLPAGGVIVGIGAAPDTAGSSARPWPCRTASCATTAC
jgi:hypothetical protein